MPGGRASLAGWQAFAVHKTAEAEGGTFNLGGAAVKLTLGTTIAYDSNINASGVDPIWDISVTPRFTIGVIWPITRQNELNLQVGIEYRKYLINPDYDDNGFIIDPGTVLEYRVFSGDFVFTIYDSPAIMTEPGTDPGVFNTVNFRQLENTFGVAVLHDLNKLTTTLGVERTDFRTLSGTFRSSDRTSYVLYGGSFYSVTPTTQVGFRGALSTNEYVENVLNDSVTALGGLVLSSSVTPSTRYYIEAGMQGARFSDNGKQETTLTFNEQDGFNEDVSGTLGGSDYLQPYFRVSVINQLNRYVEHSLVFSREAQGSTVANYNENNSISYAISWRMNRLIWTHLITTYDFGQISAVSTPVDYSRWQTRMSMSLYIARDTTIDLFYDYLVNDLAITNGTYDRQRFGVSLIWAF